MQILKYRGTRNIGDAIQSYALARLFSGQTNGVWRDSGESNPDELFIVNGWIGRNKPPLPGGRPIFAGIFLQDATSENRRWMAEGGRNGMIVGARDTATVTNMAYRGIESLFVGCATLTLPEYHGPRAGVYNVDAEPEHGGTAVPHGIPEGMAWHDQWEHAFQLLNMYRTAELVTTTRLHAALPCLAFGTPVKIKHPRHLRNPNSLERFSVVDALGIPYDKVIYMHDPYMPVKAMGWRWRATLLHNIATIGRANDLAFLEPALSEWKCVPCPL